MTNNDLFAALYKGYYEVAPAASRAAFLEYIVPAVDRWNLQWGDGALDPFSNQILKSVHTSEKNLLRYFGKGARIVSGSWTKKSGVYFCIAEAAGFDFSLLPAPDLVIERATGRRYRLYRLEDYDKL